MTHVPHKTPHQDFKIKVVTETTEKVFTDLLKAKKYFMKLFKDGLNPKIERVGERPVSKPN